MCQHTLAFAGCLLSRSPTRIGVYVCIYVTLKAMIMSGLHLRVYLHVLCALQNSPPNESSDICVYVINFDAVQKLNNACGRSRT